ncbi:MAG TPA: tetratricopeptide repeat protein [Parafilimonas sp.]|nr:tetratricopeptide repeat protein [Parafilimonas sp.]
MPGTMEYIESYFQQTLNSEERAAFEVRCERDEAFAKDVAFYITARQALREELLEQKIGEWKKEVAIEEEAAPVISMVKRKTTFGRWAAYVAAACVVLAVSVYLFDARTTPQKLAAAYVNNTLSQTMDASRDSIQLGIAAYNDQEYDRALQLFEGVEQRDPSNSDAKKYAGLTYLQKQDYDKALQQFDELANMKVFSNPGDFLKATTLLLRNKQGDKEEAKALLQKVVNEKEEESQKAEEWLKKF